MTNHLVALNKGKLGDLQVIHVVEPHPKDVKLSTKCRGLGKKG